MLYGGKNMKLAFLIEEMITVRLIMRDLRRDIKNNMEFTEKVKPYRKHLEQIEEAIDRIGNK